MPTIFHSFTTFPRLDDIFQTFQNRHTREPEFINNVSCSKNKTCWWTTLRSRTSQKEGFILKSWAPCLCSLFLCDVLLALLALKIPILSPRCPCLRSASHSSHAVLGIFRSILKSKQDGYSAVSYSSSFVVPPFEYCSIRFYMLKCKFIPQFPEGGK